MSCRRLTEAEVADARRAHAEGYTARLLARAYRVSQTAMRRALAEETYKGQGEAGRKLAASPE